MKQILIKNGEVVVEEIACPGCPDGFVLVENRYSLISTGTESSIVKQGEASLISKALEQPALIKKTFQSMKEQGLSSTLELIKGEKEKIYLLGYSCAGIVREVGAGVNNYSPGDRVACAGAGFANHSEFVAVPRNLIVRLPDTVPFSHAAFTTVGAIAMQGVRQAKVELGHRVVVSGLGLIGLLTVQLLKAAGCKVLGLDLDEKRVQRALELGCDLGLLASSPDEINRQLDRFTEGMGVDVVLICAATSSTEPIRQAMKFCRKKGRVVIVGTVGMDLERSPFYEKELELTISCSYGPGRYDPKYELQGEDYPIGYVRFTENRNMQEFVRLLAEEKVKVESLCEEEFPIAEGVSAYASLEEKKPLGVLLRYGEDTKEPVKKIIHPLAQRTEGKVRVAVMGLGAITKNVHLPNLKKIPSCQIHAIISQRGVQARKTAEKYRAAISATELAGVETDMVLIANRDRLHAPSIIEAAHAGLAIFCEKPMTITREEADKVKKIIEETRVHFTVGFNRRFSPLAVKARELLQKKSGPAFINYRVNAETIPLSHWINDPKEGGGRFIGEACHFIDLFSYLLDADPIDCSALNLSASGSKGIDDNVAATLKYRDGSVATLTYVTVGGGGLAKERIEIFADQKTMLLDNFQALHLYGYSGESDIKLKSPDKGLKQQLEEFIKKIQGKPSNSISLEEAYNTTIWTLKLHDLFQGKTIPGNNV
jgi:predicted dehydrogenase/threonine dehydrogenase-like Zn-dependent dehydrogenase